MDETDRERWNAGLAQFDCARKLLIAVGISAGYGDLDLMLDVESPRLARMLLDALRAVYDVEIERLGNAQADHVPIPLREVPTLRNFIVDAERRLGRATKHQLPILSSPDKRAPESVKWMG